MTNTTRFLRIAIVALLLVSGPVSAVEQSDVLSRIEAMAAAPAANARNEEWQAIADSVKSNPTEITRALVAKLDDPQLTEQRLATYIWALGQAQDSTALVPVIRAYEKHRSESIRQNSLKAIAAIGGAEAGRFILSTLETSTDEPTRFEALNLLGQMQYEEALPRMDELLGVSAQKFWQAIFVFGKMGDKAVPFLLDKIDSPDANKRRNVIDLLGHWLIPLEAAKAIENRFWKEPDEQVRVLLLASLETMVTDADRMKSFVERVISKDKSKPVLEYARGTLKMLTRLKANSTGAAWKTTPSPAVFQAEYEQLYRSAGKRGDYKALFSASTVQDEQRLKTLRERVLQRDSDEAFDDFQKINEIIISNRWRKLIGN